MGDLLVVKGMTKTSHFIKKKASKVKVNSAYENY